MPRALAASGRQERLSASYMIQLLFYGTCSLLLRLHPGVQGRRATPAEYDYEHIATDGGHLQNGAHTCCKGRAMAPSSTPSPVPGARGTYRAGKTQPRTILHLSEIGRCLPTSQKKPRMMATFRLVGQVASSRVAVNERAMQPRTKGGSWSCIIP